MGLATRHIKENTIFINCPLSCLPSDRTRSRTPSFSSLATSPHTELHLTGGGIGGIPHQVASIETLSSGGGPPIPRAWSSVWGGSFNNYNLCALMGGAWRTQKGISCRRGSIKIILNQLNIYPKPYLILIDFFACDICF